MKVSGSFKQAFQTVVFFLGKSCENNWLPCPFALYISGLTLAKIFAKEVEIWSGGGSVFFK